MDKTLLEVLDLRTHFFTRRGIVKAVDGVSFSIRQGETLGIVGESGCGKSITAFSILRLVPQPAGRIVNGKILFDGVDLLQLNEKEMRKLRGNKLSMITQDPASSLNPVFTIGEQVAEAIRTHQMLRKKTLRQRTVEMLKLVRIPSPELRLRDWPHQMSGGMKQRIMGAIALACQPHLLIADEPTTFLDTTVQAQYLKLLKELQQTANITMIFITHDFGIVANMCDRVAVMYAGRIVENAELRELFNNPLHPYTIALMNSLPKLEVKVERLYSIEGQPPDLSNLPKGCIFAPRCAKAREECYLQYPPQVTVSEGHSLSCWQVA